MTHGNKGRGESWSRGQGGRRAAAELAMQARKNRQTQIEVHNVRFDLCLSALQLYQRENNLILDKNKVNKMLIVSVKCKLCNHVNCPKTYYSI